MLVIRCDATCHDCNCMNMLHNILATWQHNFDNWKWNKRMPSKAYRTWLPRFIGVASKWKYVIFCLQTEQAAGAADGAEENQDDYLLSISMMHFYIILFHSLIDGACRCAVRIAGISTMTLFSCGRVMLFSLCSNSSETIPCCFVP